MSWKKELYQQSNFNPHAPRGARPQRTRSPHFFPHFNQHAPRGARLGQSGSCSRRLQFQSTRPSRGATIHIGLVPLIPRYFNPHAPRGARQQMCTKITYIFALTHKRNTFSCQTPSVRALSKKLSGRFSHKIRCEPPCKTMCAAAPHYTISVPSGRYVCLQPKCSILLSYFFPK